MLCVTINSKNSQISRDVDDVKDVENTIETDEKILMVIWNLYNFTKKDTVKNVTILYILSKHMFLVLWSLVFGLWGFPNGVPIQNIYTGILLGFVVVWRLFL